MDPHDQSADGWGTGQRSLKSILMALKKDEELQLLFQTVHISVEAVGGQWNQKLYANQ